MSRGSCFSLQFLILITASSDLFTDVLLILLLKRKAVRPFLSYPPLYFSLIPLTQAQRQAAAACCHQGLRATLSFSRQDEHLSIRDKH